MTPRNARGRKKGVSTTIAENDDGEEKVFHSEGERKAKLEKKILDDDPETFALSKRLSVSLEGSLQKWEASDLARDADLGIGLEKASSQVERRSDGTGEELKTAFQKVQSGLKYKSMVEERERLPAFQLGDLIVTTISNNRVVVISGSTGCGKSTQIPQLVLQHEMLSGRGDRCNILCTQPRRVSAIGVAGRVAEELGEGPPGSGLIGYKIRLERRLSERTRLLFCTDGILLRRLRADPLLTGVSHVFLDEVHERNVDTDFLLIVLRDLLEARGDLRVVLMSATMNADTFAHYFSTAAGGAVKVHIPGLAFPVEELFLEDALQWTRYDLTKRNATRGKNRNAGSFNFGHLSASYMESLAKKGYPQDVIESIQAFDEDSLPYGVVMSLVEKIDACQAEGAILIFLTGYSDICKMHNLLKESKRAKKFSVYPLHGSMPTAQQKTIFQKPPQGTRKIVIATNIAESSITIDDVVYVIDCGKHKEKTYDDKANLSSLLPAWVSRSSAQQRKGRAGRVREGKCWHLFPSIYMNALKEYPLPEILRTSLDQLCLQVRGSHLATPGIGGIQSFALKALTPPTSLALDNAINKLVQIGALHAHNQGLTPLGCHLSALPLEPNIGKALVYANLFGCLDPVLTICAILGHKSPFLMPLHSKLKADRSKRDFAQGEPSDHRAMLEAYDQWMEAERNDESRDFCKRRFLSEQTLKTIRQMRDQLRNILLESGEMRTYAPSDSIDPQPRCEWGLIKAVLVAGLYPNLIRVDPDRHQRQTRFLTKSNGQVTPHPGSVNATHNDWEHRWLVYHDKQRTESGIFVYDSTEVSPLPILMFGGVVGNDAYLPFDSKGRPWGSAGKNKDDASEALGGVFAKRSDPVVQFMKELLLSHGGSFKIAALDEVLKRDFPERRERMGPVRKWIDDHDDLFRIDKRGGAWTVTYVGDYRNERVERESKTEKTPPFFGVEDWIYFRGGERDSRLIFRCKTALDKILLCRIESSTGLPSSEEEGFLAACRDAFIEDDLYPNRR